MIQNIANSVQIWQNGLILTTTKIRGFEEYGCFFSSVFAITCYFSLRIA